MEPSNVRTALSEFGQPTRPDLKNLINPHASPPERSSALTTGCTRTMYPSFPKPGPLSRHSFHPYANSTYIYRRLRYNQSMRLVSRERKLPLPVPELLQLLHSRNGIKTYQQLDNGVHYAFQQSNENVTLLPGLSRVLFGTACQSRPVGQGTNRNLTLKISGTRVIIPPKTKTTLIRPRVINEQQPGMGFAKMEEKLRLCDGREQLGDPQEDDWFAQWVAQ